MFVTHDQEEALEVADRVVVMDKGRIEQIGTPKEVYERPATAFVHEFIGELIVVPVEVAEGRVLFGGEPTGLDPRALPQGAARLFVRPFELAIVPPQSAPLGRRKARARHRSGAPRGGRSRRRAQETVVELDPPRAWTCASASRSACGRSNTACFRSMPATRLGNGSARYSGWMPAALMIAP